MDWILAGFRLVLSWVGAAGQALAAKAWDEAVHRRALEIAGDLAPYDVFRRGGVRISKRCVLSS
jgi:hypothetical protein